MISVIFYIFYNFFPECSHLGNPENGTILGNVNKIGAVWRQNCNTGYYLEAGSNMLICDTDGHWNSTKCIRDCVPLSNYTGHLSITKLGYQCQRWELNTPHPHDYHSPEYFPDGSEQQAENYCRSAGFNFLWCYTTDADQRWDTCNNPDEIC
ncbi:plasminogen-like [Ruditapes philippinarum]|uniref:plasminogen-like n=1 Tax=Ruditapes philippinarum TaxID=129788 RepID=UPI00295B740E|nr:plasminogen-like [Ruditapes philippinarum]